MPISECGRGASWRVDRVFERSLNPDQTRQPVAGVRVLAGVKMSNPYPNPRQTRALTRGFSKPVTIPMLDPLLILQLYISENGNCL